MDHEEFGWLVHRLEAEAANRPASYRAKVVLISCAAYIALLLALAVYAALVILGWGYMSTSANWIRKAFFVLFTLGALSVFYGVVRTLLTRIDPPAGREITRAEAPVLFNLLDKMRARMKGPPIHHVLVDEQYNASITQLPKWGLAGPATNYLTLGLPYLLGGPTSEIMAVVAHEYGHLCGSHGSLYVWIYRQRATLEAVYEKVRMSEDTSLWHGLMARLLERFMPYHDAYTFVLARQDEYEADRSASQLAGPEAAAQSLVRGELQGRWFADQFWQTLYKQAETRDVPAFMPYQAMHTAFKMSHREWATEAHLKHAWKIESGVADTHPCLRERVEALGQQARLPRPITSSAASALLGPFAKTLVDEFDRAWWGRASGDWSKRRRHAERSRQRLAELAGMPLARLALHDLQELAMLTVEFGSAQAAKAALEHLLRQPGGPFPKAELTYGRILLGEGDSDGLPYLRSAARNDRRLSGRALRSGHAFLLEKRGEQAAEAWINEALQAA